MASASKIISALAPKVSFPQTHYRKNLGLTDASDLDPEMAAWLAARQGKQDPIASANRIVDEHFADTSPTKPPEPEEAIGEVALGLGNLEATEQATNRFYDGLKGRRVLAPEGSVTGRAPSIIPDLGIRSRSMGKPPRVAVTKTTPQHLMNLVSGGPERGAEIAGRQATRNDPLGQNGAVIYHMGNHLEALQRPWLVHRGLDGGFYEPNELQGYANPLSRTVWFNNYRDYANRDSNALRKRMNVGEHEIHHTYQDGEIPDRQYLINQKLLHEDEAGPFIAPNPQPIILHTDFERLPQGDLYTAMDAAEMHNLLTHMKRLTEATEPTMRDIGASRNSVENFVDWMLNRPTQRADPIINQPGHHRHGQPAWGREELLEQGERIFNAAEPKGQKAILDSLFKTGDTSPLRTALLT